MTNERLLHLQESAVAGSVAVDMGGGAVVAAVVPSVDNGVLGSPESAAAAAAAALKRTLRSGSAGSQHSNSSSEKTIEQLEQVAMMQAQDAILDEEITSVEDEDEDLDPDLLDQEEEANEETTVPLRSTRQSTAPPPRPRSSPRNTSSSSASTSSPYSLRKRRRPGNPTGSASKAPPLRNTRRTSTNSATSVVATPTDAGATTTETPTSRGDPPERTCIEEPNKQSPELNHTHVAAADIIDNTLFLVPTALETSVQTSLPATTAASASAAAVPPPAAATSSPGVSTRAATRRHSDLNAWPSLPLSVPNPLSLLPPSPTDATPAVVAIAARPLAPPPRGPGRPPRSATMAATTSAAHALKGAAIVATAPVIVATVSTPPVAAAAAAAAAPLAIPAAAPTPTTTPPRTRSNTATSLDPVVSSFLASSTRVGGGKTISFAEPDHPGSCYSSSSIMRTRGFSMDMDGKCLDRNPPCSLALTHTLVVAMGLDTLAEDTASTAGRDRAFSFECFAFGINEDEPLPPLAESCHPGAVYSNMDAFRPRGDSIIFDPVSFQDGGIHEQTALTRVVVAAAPAPNEVVALPVLESEVDKKKGARGRKGLKGGADGKKAKLGRPLPGPKSSAHMSSSWLSRSSLVDHSAGTLVAALASMSRSVSDNHSTGSTASDQDHGSLTYAAELLNKNGRIGIYLPEARRARIARFHAKRENRIWRKRIKYDCRKKLADSRPRIKGRFVKRCEDEEMMPGGLGE
jgi:CCT motif